MIESIDFHKIEETGQPLEVDATIEVCVEDLEIDDLQTVSDVRVELTASKGDVPGEYVVEGRFTFQADVLCSRCLDPVPFANDSEFAVRFRPHPSGDTGESEIEIDEGDLEVEHYSEPTLSLARFAAEQVELALPMKLLCDDACLGLCSKCGANKRRQPCDCGKEDVDERWAVLSQFRDELSKKDH